MNSSDGAVVLKKLGANVSPPEVLQTMAEYATAWIGEVKRAGTQRAAIASWERDQVRRIDAQRTILLTALDLTFDERRENFRRVFDGLDAAMISGDASQAAAYLESITDLARTSPFKDLADLEIVVSDLKRPDQVWDV